MFMITVVLPVKIRLFSNVAKPFLSPLYNMETFVDTTVMCQILIFYEQPIYNELCFMLDCEGGGTRTDISGQLNFLRGSGPHERECEWTIENPDNSSNVIVTGFHNSEDCGYGFIDSHMLLHSQSFHIWWSSLCIPCCLGERLPAVQRAGA